jgi:hypothetical protein
MLANQSRGVSQLVLKKLATLGDLDLRLTMLEKDNYK